MKWASISIYIDHSKYTTKFSVTRVVLLETSAGGKTIGEFEPLKEVIKQSVVGFEFGDNTMTWWRNIYGQTKVRCAYLLLWLCHQLHREAQSWNRVRWGQQRNPCNQVVCYASKHSVISFAHARKRKIRSHLQCEWDWVRTWPNGMFGCVAHYLISFLCRFLTKSFQKLAFLHLIPAYNRQRKLIK
jgi:hypothetical protein